MPYVGEPLRVEHRLGRPGRDGPPAGHDHHLVRHRRREPEVVDHEQHPQPVCHQPIEHPREPRRRRQVEVPGERSEGPGAEVGRVYRLEDGRTILVRSAP